MKGKLPIIVTAIVAIAMVLSLAASFAPATTVIAATADKMTAVTMPTQDEGGQGNLAVNTDIVALVQAADGTLFAGVYDESGTRWNFNNEETSYYAVFTSTNGYDWTKGYTLPWDDDGPIVEIVPVPGYSANNSIVYMVTQYFVYISENGGKTFTRTDATVPYVGVADNVIYSLDVAANIAPVTGYTCVVGTVGTNAGVFTYNKYGTFTWVDEKIGDETAANSATTGVLDVAFSPRYTADKDKVLIAVAIFEGTLTQTVRGTLGTWNVEALDVAFPDVSGVVYSAQIAFPSDYNWKSNPRTFVGVWADNGSDVYRLTSILSEETNAKHLNLRMNVYDIVVNGSGTGTQVMAVTNSSSSNGLQVYLCTAAGGSTFAWTQSQKAPIGYGYNEPGYLVWGADAFVASCDDDYTPSGVSKMVNGALGMAWNGVGLIDTVVATKTYLEDSDTTYGGPFWVEASPNNNVDNTIFMCTLEDGYSTNWGLVYLWRTSDGGANWDMIACEEQEMLDGNIDEDYDAWSNEAIDMGAIWYDGEALSVRTTPGFSNVKGSTDQTMFILGWNEAKDAPWFFKSTDAGNTWKPIIAMPYSTEVYSHTAWCVVNGSTLIVSDDDGWIYTTFDNGNNWIETSLSDGVVTDLKFYQDPARGLIVLAGVSDDMGGSSSSINCEVWISLDGAAHFVQVGSALADVPVYTPEQIAPVMVDFDNNFKTNNMIYAAFGITFDRWEWYDDFSAATWIKDAQSDCGIWRTAVTTVDPTSSMWDPIVTTEDFSALLPQSSTFISGNDLASRMLFPTGLQVGPENTIYVTYVLLDVDSHRNTWGGFIRCIDGTATDPQWDFVDDGLPGYGGLWMASVVAGSNNLFTIGYRYDDYNDNSLVDTRLLNYRDTLAGKAGGMVPASGAKNVGTISGGKANVVLSWGNISGTKYDWQVALDSNFDNIVKSGTATDGKSSAIASGLELGTTYYWRVKATEPTTGPWSSTVSFTTVNTVSGAPTLKDTVINDGKAVLSWTSVQGATSYKVQIATDSGFVGATEKTATTTIYGSDKLSDGTYYWRVQATVGSDTTSWSDPGVFTIGGSSTTSTDTPPWVWVLIALGVVLAIFVLVLILRTRRPV